MASVCGRGGERLRPGGRRYDPGVDEAGAEQRRDLGQWIGGVQNDGAELNAAQARRGHVATPRLVREAGFQARDLRLRHAGEPALQEVVVVREVEVLALDRKARLRVAGL